MDQTHIDHYSPMSDRELIDLVTGQPCDGLAAEYLLQVKYGLLLRKIYNEVFGKQKTDWFEDCMSDLKEYLMGKDIAWQKLANIENKENITAWLETTAKRRFVAIKPNLAGKFSDARSLDDEDSDRPAIQIPIDDEQLYDDRERITVVLEAMTLLSTTERFCMMKDIKDVPHKYIAEMLRIKWEREGTQIKSSKKDGGFVVPDAAYVDVQIQRAKKKILRYYNKQYSK